MTENNQHTKWSLVYRTTEEHLAILMRMKLEEHNIPFRYLDQIDKRFNNFGEISLQVPENFAAMAKKIITSDE